MNEEKIVVNTTGEKILIQHQEIAREEAPYDGNRREYELESLGSVVEVVKRKGSSDNTVMFYNTSGVQVIFDDTIQDKSFDKSIMKFSHHGDIKKWLGVCGIKLSQKDFAKFLKRNKSPITNIYKDLLKMSISNIKFDTIKKGEFVETDEGVTVCYSEKKTEKSAKIPSDLVVSLRNLAGSDVVEDVNFELELIIPKSEEERPYFVLECINHEEVYESTIEKEINMMKEKLEGYLILNGKW